MARKSVGKVKLRRANGTIMFTVPKTIQPKIEHLVGKTFESVHTQTESLDMIIFTRKRFKVTYGHPSK